MAYHDFQDITILDNKVLGIYEFAFNAFALTWVLGNGFQHDIKKVVGCNI